MSEQAAAQREQAYQDRLADIERLASELKLCQSALAAVGAKYIRETQALREWAKDEQKKRHDAEDARVEARSEAAHYRLALDGIASDVRVRGCEACAEKESMARAALGSV